MDLINAKTPCYQQIPTNLTLEQFNPFVLPHLSIGRQGGLYRSGLQIIRA